MKKNYLFRTAMCLGIATMMSFCLTSGTYAKYVSAVTGSDSARVAKFVFSISDGSNSGNQSTSSEITIDLFNTVRDTTGKAAETDISASDGTIIAPGTMGWVAITVNNTGEVSFKTVFDLSASDLESVPLEFTVVASDPSSIDFSSQTFYSVSDTAISTALSNGTIAHTTGTETHYLVWRWPLGTADAVDDTTNSTDTTLGIAGSATPKVTIKCTVIQVE